MVEVAAPKSEQKYFLVVTVWNCVEITPRLFDSRKKAEKLYRKERRMKDSKSDIYFFSGEMNDYLYLEKSYDPVEGEEREY